VPLRGDDTWCSGRQSGTIRREPRVLKELKLPDAETAAVVLIVAVRGLVPFTVLRWPFWGGVLCIAGDVFDSAIEDLLGVDPLGGAYHRVDKAFDAYYLSFEAYVVWHLWTDSLARTTALILFAARFAAVVAFEITHARALFLLGANVFENFYLYIAGRLEIDPTHRLASRRQLLVILAFVGLPKLLQEYVMHFREAQTWHFVTRHILKRW
jgi:hypothetical protein